MRRSAILSLLAAAVLVAPQTAVAQTQAYQTCSASGNNFLAGLCFNWTLSHAVNTNTIMLNVSSAGPAIGNLNAFAIWLPNLNQGLGILNPAFSTASGGTTSTGSPALSDWSSNSIDAPLRMASGFDFGAGTQDKHHGNEGICFGAAGGNCWFTPATEYLSFTFEFGSTFGLIDLTGAGAGAKWQSIGSNSGPSFDCAFTSSDATNSSSFGSCSTTTMTTPEPAALVLTATGLLGLGIVARRRKAVA